MAEDIVLSNLENPEYWREVIDDDENADVRSNWLKQCEESEDLLHNRTQHGVAGFEIAPSDFHKIRKYLTSHLAYSDYKVKVQGTEKEDEKIADVYRDAIEWEFRRPRGINSTVGRDEISSVLEDWIDYGIGDCNVYFNPYVRDEENWNGSIITESVCSKGIILDSSAERFKDIGHFARKQLLRQDIIASMFPFYEGKFDLSEAGKTYVYDVQFTTTKPVTVKLNTPALAEEFGNYKPYWDEATEKAQFIDMFGEASNKKAEKIWKSLASDTAFTPCAYSIVFLGDEEGNNITDLVRGATYLGKRPSHSLIPFAELPGTPYPVGAAFFIKDLIMIKTYLISLYLELAANMNNSGGGINIDKVYGANADSKLGEINRMMTEKNYWVPFTGVNNMNEVIMQLKRQGPDRTILEAYNMASMELDSIFNTHASQIGRIEYSGQPAKLTEMLQAVGAFSLSNPADKVRRFMSDIFRKIAYNVYEYMPPEKKIAVSSAYGDEDYRAVKREEIQQINPLTLDINVELDVETERDKTAKAITGFELYDRQVISKRELLVRTGEKHPDYVLNELQDEALGRLIVAQMKQDPNLEKAVNAGLEVSLMDSKMKEAGNEPSA